MRFRAAISYRDPTIPLPKSHTPEPMTSPMRPMLTPCIGVCTLDPQGYCDGCRRTGAEIAMWSSMGDDARARFMSVVLPEREARDAAGLPLESARR